MSSRPGGGWVIVHTTCRISALPRGRPHPNNPRVRVRRRRQKVIDDGRTCVRPPQLTPCLPNKPKLTPHTPNPPIIAPCLNPHFFPHADQVLCFSWSPFLCVVTRDGTMVRVLGLWRGSVVGQEKGHKLERAFVFGTPANPCCNGRRRRGRQAITPCLKRTPPSRPQIISPQLSRSGDSHEVSDEISAWCRCPDRVTHAPSCKESRKGLLVQMSSALHFRCVFWCERGAMILVILHG